ncbi:response regulator transcription factor [Streptomyces erythrochromogenes]|uniref:response regulator transcription factor n=1 Tax=Streptomyces erythrochromogenes TaxID=285574 RepID=UPI003867D1D1|nr:helix-turn-helix transcriptional regulator [Streptomyces erythrochromogenes]
MRVVSFSVPAWFPSYEEPDGPPAQHGAQSCEALLTEQESAVFLCLATGASNRELAGELQLSVSTVKFHVVNIRAKLGGISRLQACLLAALAREGSRPAGPGPLEGETFESGTLDGGTDESRTDESRARESDGGLSAAGGAAVPR